MPNILLAQNIQKSYSHNKNEFIALHETSIAIEKGKIHVIMGKSGSGKSTLLNLLGGLDNPTSGDVYFSNYNYYRLSASKQARIRGKHFGYVFQMFYLIPELSVKDNIILPIIINKKEFNQQYFNEIVELLGIKSKLARFPNELSGGEQQRVAIARALINRPSIVFADEPTGNLDSKNSEHVMDILYNINIELQTTILIVTHDSYLVKQPHILYEMHDGKIMW